MFNCEFIVSTNVRSSNVRAGCSQHEPPQQRESLNVSSTSTFTVTSQQQRNDAIAFAIQQLQINLPVTHEACANLHWRCVLACLLACLLLLLPQINVMRDKQFWASYYSHHMLVRGRKFEVAMHLQAATTTATCHTLIYSCN